MKSNVKFLEKELPAEKFVQLSINQANHLKESKQPEESENDKLQALWKTFILETARNDFAKEKAKTGTLNQIKILDLTRRKLNSLPKGIELLMSLEKIDLSCNEFTKFPEEFEKSNNLVTIHLEGNKLEELPTDQILKIKSLKNLYVGENPIEAISIQLKHFINEPYPRNFTWTN